jgi:6-pyruvoyltetrahydropterin/6-carboxytetrahydropterin synthase
MKVTKEFDFSAGHRLSNYSGACRRLHGHNYHLKVTIESDSLDVLGMVIDFGELKAIVKKEIDTRFDHRLILKSDDAFNQNLSAALPKEDDSIYWVSYNPTAENIAADIFNILYDKIIDIYKTNLDKRLVSVVLYETLTSSAEVTQYAK